MKIILFLMAGLLSSVCLAGGGGVGEYVGGTDYLFCISEDETLTFKVRESCYEESSYTYCQFSVYVTYKNNRYSFNMPTFKPEKRSGVFKDESNGFLVDSKVSVVSSSYLKLTDVDNKKTVIPKTTVKCSPT